MVANTSGLDAAVNPMEVINAVNAQTNGGLGLGIIFTSFVIVFSTAMANGQSYDKSLIYSGFFEFFIISGFIALEWVAFYWIMFPIVLLGAGIMLNILK